MGEFPGDFSSRQSYSSCMMQGKGYVPHTQARIKHRIWPRTMVKCLGNKPVRSHPTGIELLVKFVTNVANAFNHQISFANLYRDPDEIPESRQQETQASSRPDSSSDPKH